MAVVGENIRRLRIKAGLSARQLAEKAGLSTVAMIECGHRPGRMDTLERIAKALGVPMGDLFAEAPGLPRRAGKQAV